MRLSKLHWGLIKFCVFMLCSSPFLGLVYDAIYNQLGANAIETLHFRLGDWALRFLCIGLALTPIRKLFKQNWVMRFRRMIGLFAFFYASLHLIVYIVLDLSLSWEEFIEEVPESPYILVGLLTYILLIPLAITSTKGMQRRLGKRWMQLHKLTYFACITAVIHYLWLVKSDLTEPLYYAAVVVVLLLIRVLPKRKKQAKRSKILSS